MSKNNLEIERKYLIKMPDMEELRKAENYDWSEIEQVYVNDTMDGMFGRIRKRGKNCGSCSIRPAPESPETS